MSEHRLLLAFALALTARTAPAQDLADWRRRAAEQIARVAVADSLIKHADDRRTYDRVLVVGDLRVSYVTNDLSERDTLALRDGLTQATETLRARYGEAGVALAKGGSWSVEFHTPERRGASSVFRFRRASDWTNSGFVAVSLPAREIESLVLAYAGERLTKATPSLMSFNGWSALQPEHVQYAEIARRLSTSWAGSVRRCAAGALDACATVLAPFDERGEPTRYFDPADFRTVVASARLPALGDSVYFDARRRCLAGADSVCARVIERVSLPDPLNAQVRGTLVAHAVELGGAGAVARAAERTDAPALETLAHIAGVSADSLLGSWRARVYDALDEDRGAAGFPLLFSSLAWGGLLLLASTKRRYL